MTLNQHDLTAYPSTTHLPPYPQSPCDVEPPVHSDGLMGAQALKHALDTIPLDVLTELEDHAVGTQGPGVTRVDLSIFLPWGEASQSRHLADVLRRLADTVERA